MFSSDRDKMQIVKGSRGAQKHGGAKTFKTESHISFCNLKITT